MTLNYVSLASTTNTLYNSLKECTEGTGDQVKYPADPGTAWIDAFKTNYDADAIAGTFDFASVVMESKPTLLAFDNTGNTCTPSGTSLGEALQNYWVSQLKVGTPQYKSTISSITNNASSFLASDIDGYLCGVTSILQEPSYENFFKFIEDKVKTIEWSVTEVGPDSTTYTVKIS